MKFDKGQFNCDGVSSRRYDDIKAECDKKDGIGVTIKTISLERIIIIVLIMAVLCAIGYYIVSEILIRKRAKNTTGLSVRYLDTKLSKKVQDAYQVDNMSVDNMIEIYTIGYNYGIISSVYNIIGAIILKWVFDGAIKLDCEDDKLNFSIYKINDISSESSMEIALYKILFNRDKDENDNEVSSEVSNEGSNDDKIDIYEFERIVRDNITELMEWINTALLSISRKIEDDGLLKSVELSNRVKKHMTFTEFICTKELNIKATQLLRLKEKRVDGNNITNNELLFVQLFGATSNLESISNDMKKLIMIINKINQIVTIRIESHLRANKKEVINEYIEKLYRKLGL
jgi:hypothetical protein